MADITMCDNEECPLKMSCFRYRAKPSPYWQPYYVINESSPVGDECIYQWIFKDEEELDKLNRMWHD
jgi:predicted amidophosphoribosyltransferase